MRAQRPGGLRVDQVVGAPFSKGGGHEESKDE